MMNATLPPAPPPPGADSELMLDDLGAIARELTERLDAADAAYRVRLSFFLRLREQQVPYRTIAAAAGVQENAVRAAVKKAHDRGVTPETALTTDAMH